MSFLLIDIYYNVISVFDNKYLIYKNNKLDIDDCNKKNLKILFSLIILYVQKLIMLIVYMIMNSYEYL